jgi:cytochrome P450
MSERIQRTSGLSRAFRALRAGRQPARSELPLPAGPRIPAALQLVRWGVAPTQFLTGCRARYGDRFTLRLPGFGSPLVVFSDPDGIQAMISHPRAKVSGAKLALRPILDDSSVVLTSGPDNAQMRKLLMAPFHGQRMHAYGDVIADMTDRMLASWRPGSTLLFHPAMVQLTLDIIIDALFGDECDDVQAQVGKLYLQWASHATKPHTIFPFLRRDLGPRSPWAAFKRSKAELDSAILQVIRRRRATAAGNDTVGDLISARYDDGLPLDDNEICIQLRTLLITGHETSATAMAWTLAWLVREVEVLRELQAQLRACSTLAAQAAVPLLDACMKESMRLTPMVPILMRKLEVDAELAGCHVPAGVTVGACAYLAHRRSEVFPEPERFMPERFIGRSPSPYAYFPFGVGRRICLGMPFAMREMKIVLARLLARATLASADRSPLRTARRGTVLAPGGDVPVRIEAITAA